MANLLKASKINGNSVEGTESGIVSESAVKSKGKRNLKYYYRTNKDEDLGWIEVFNNEKITLVPKTKRTRESNETIVDSVVMDYFCKNDLKDVSLMPSKITIYNRIRKSLGTFIVSNYEKVGLRLKYTFTVEA